MTDHLVHALSSGIRLLFQHSPSSVTHCCFIVNAGSRDEAPGKAGLAHFIEHLLFKETRRRSTNQILNRLEMVGGDLNAYTTKEYTCIHASFLKQHLERAFDLFEDIIFNSTFPANEQEKEKSVILDEIASYLDQPEEAIQDDFEGMLFKDHALGENILGTAETVNGLNGQDIGHFILNNYDTHQMVFAVSGNYLFTDVVRSFEKYFISIPGHQIRQHRAVPARPAPGIYTLKKAISQTHCVMGTQAYPLSSDKKYALLLLNNLLGGIGMSSRLNLQVREKYGIAYTIESNYTPLSDTGLFTIYFGTDTEKAGKASSLIYRELKKLRDNKLTALQLSQNKQKFNGQIALAEENRMGLIISMAKSLLDFNRIDTLEQVFEKVNAVTAEELLAISNEILDPLQMLTLIFEPI